MKEPIVPTQREGAIKNFQEFRSFDSNEQAQAHYKVVQERLADINHWHQYATLPAAQFQLTDAGGKLKDGIPVQGDCVRIDVPGPGEPDGAGYDWVSIEFVGKPDEADKEQFVIQLRPTSNPMEGAKSDTAHFFSDAATSTFVVSVDNAVVTLDYFGRNETLNSEGGIIDKVRNALTGIMAWLGLSDIQWKDLISGLIA